jgi:hypothetical protein
VATAETQGAALLLEIIRSTCRRGGNHEPGLFPVRNGGRPRRAGKGPSMGTMIKFVWQIMAVALALGYAGNLVDLTLAMRKQAADAHQHGMISLRAWNNRLQK